MLTLPTSVFQCAALVASGAVLRRTVLSEADAKAALQVAASITLPAFVYEAIAHPTFHIGAAVVALSAAFAHALVSAAMSWFLFRKRSRRDAALLRSSSVGADIGSLTLAWCCCTWGIAGAEVAAVFTCATALTQHLAARLLAASARSARPRAVQHADGGVYDGEWQEQQKSGHGVYTYSSGARYEGEWLDGAKHGFGTHHYADGAKFEGQFVAGQRSGLGVRTWLDGTSRMARFHNGKMQGPSDLYEAGPVLQACQEAAARARDVAAELADIHKPWKQVHLYLPLLAAAAAVTAQLLQWAPSDAIAMPLGTAASVHVPLCLLAWGALWAPVQLPRLAGMLRSRIKPVCQVLAVRLLPGLATAAVVLHSTPPELVLAIRAAAIAACLMAPISPLVHTCAVDFQLNAGLASALSAASDVASAGLIAMFAFVAWLHNVHPFFIYMRQIVASIEPLITASVLSFGVCAAFFTVAPKVAERGVTQPRRVVKMRYVGDAGAQPALPGASPNASTSASGTSSEAQNPDSPGGRSSTSANAFAGSRALAPWLQGHCARRKHMSWSAQTASLASSKHVQRVHGAAAAAKHPVSVRARLHSAAIRNVAKHAARQREVLRL